MTPTTRQVKLVQSTWKLVLTSRTEAGEVFYVRLLTIDPSLCTLFKNDTKSHSALLIGMISDAVNKLHQVGDIVSEVKALYPLLSTTMIAGANDMWLFPVGLRSEQNFSIQGIKNHACSWWQYTFGEQLK